MLSIYGRVLGEICSFTPLEVLWAHLAGALGSYAWRSAGRPARGRAGAARRRAAPCQGRRRPVSARVGLQPRRLRQGRRRVASARVGFQWRRLRRGRRRFASNRVG